MTPVHKEDRMAGYHVTPISRGELGDVSKIEEEFAEFKDALKQGNKVMALVELSDMLGAIDAYVRKQHKDTFTLNDLLKMTEATQRAFKDGTRK